MNRNGQVLALRVNVYKALDGLARTTRFITSIGTLDSE
jgi:hypothetical protein